MEEDDAVGIVLERGEFRMEKDPILQKEIWDARVKIVIGRFLINTFTAFFAVAIVALVLDNFVMGQQGDAYIVPVIRNWGLPIAGFTLLIGFVTNFLPKKKKIDLFTKVLYAYAAAERKIAFPATVETECLNDVPALGFRDGIRYRVWKTDKAFCFFPVRPRIERLAPYERGPVEFAVIAVPLENVKSIEKGGIVLRSYTSYDEKKKPVVGNVQHATATLRLGGTAPADVQLETSVISLIAPAPEQPAEPKTVPVSAAPKEPLPQGNDIEAKLQKLQNLYDKGLITQQEYNERKGKLLDQL